MGLMLETRSSVTVFHLEMHLLSCSMGCRGELKAADEPYMARNPYTDKEKQVQTMLNYIPFKG